MATPAAVVTKRPLVEHAESEPRATLHCFVEVVGLVFPLDNDRREVAIDESGDVVGIGDFVKFDRVEEDSALAFERRGEQFLLGEQYRGGLYTAGRARESRRA